MAGLPETDNFGRKLQVADNLVENVQGYGVKVRCSHLGGSERGGIWDATGLISVLRSCNRSRQAHSQVVPSEERFMSATSDEESTQRIICVSLALARWRLGP
jgi:hypothetical protein